MRLRDKLNCKWVKYPVAVVVTLALSAGLKYAISKVNDYVSKVASKHPDSQVSHLTAEQLDDMSRSFVSIVYAEGNPDDIPPMNKVPGLDYVFDGGVLLS